MRTAAFDKLEQDLRSDQKYMRQNMINHTVLDV